MTSFWAIIPVLFLITGAGAENWPACLGKSSPLVVSNLMPYSRVQLGEGLSGLFCLDYGTNASVVDLSSLPDLKPADGLCPLNDMDAKCEFATFDFVEPWGAVQLRNQDFSQLRLAVRQTGLLGTDFLSKNIYTIHYGGKKLFSAKPHEFCAPEVLSSLGFSALSTKGFFSHRYLKPFRTLASDYVGPWTVPNGPIVPIRLAGVEALGQIDTGFFDEKIPHSININPALYDLITAQNPNVLERWPEKDVKLSACAGQSEIAEAYRTAKASLDLVGENGKVARSFEEPTIFVKRSSPKSCGGVGVWSVPAAQIGASFYVEIDTIIFDPFAERVWIKN